MGREDGYPQEKEDIVVMLFDVYLSFRNRFVKKYHAAQCRRSGYCPFQGNLLEKRGQQLASTQPTVADRVQLNSDSCIVNQARIIGKIGWLRIA